MICYTSVKMYKNYLGLEVFVWRSKQIYTTQFTDSRIFSELA
jgi:hypothetical protein